MRVAAPALGLVLALLAALAPAPATAAAQGPGRLQPSYVCPSEGSALERWAIFNPGEAEVPFTWALHRSAESGAATAAPGVHTLVTTTRGDGPQVLMVSVGGRLLRAVPATPPCLDLETQQGALRVRAVLAADEDPALDMPAGAGVVVRIDGEEVGTSDDTGIVEVTLPPGSYDVEAVVPSFAEGAAQAVVEAGDTADVTVRLRSGGPVVEPAELEFDELEGGALSIHTDSITLRFVRDGAHLPVSKVVEVELRTAAIGSAPVDLSQYFSAAPDGTVTPHQLGFVLAHLSSVRSRATLHVRAVDDRGFSYHESVSFTPARFGAEVVLEAPPSRADLPLGGIEVHLRSGEFDQVVTTDGSGTVMLPVVPAGPLHVTASTELDGHVYSGLADVSISGDSRVRVVLLGVEDILDGVRPWFVEATFFGTSSALPDEEPSPERRAAAAATGTGHPEPLEEISATSTASIFTIAGSQNVPMSASASLEVAEGTESVTLRYEVSTAEYPFWVMQQSIYDDTWRLTVAAQNGSVLFTTGRNVNSQLYSSPVWNGAGRTGELQAELDISAFTSTGPASVVVWASATNIGDSILPTAVSATLGAEKTLTIDEIDHDRDTPTRGNHDHFSVPRPPGNPGTPASSTNTFHRTFEVTYTRPDDVTITNVRAELLTGGGAVLDTVVDAAPGSPQVTAVGDSAVRVRVTYVERQSPVASTPPPTDRIRYRFTLTGTDGSGATITSEPKESALYFALWRMPDGFDRYSIRDAGLDDWAARSTYEWLEANRHLVTRINDISGEHGRNIGHFSHREGKDMDMFHVYTLPGGAGAGAHNYQMLQAAAQDALAGDAAQLAQLEAWATATRARFDELVGDPQVRRLYYSIGNDAGTAGTVRQLEEGWAQALLEQGTYTNPGGHAITLAAGAWANAGHHKTVFDGGHNTHFHVALD